MVQTAARTDWKTIEEWNKKYIVRTFYSQDEYEWIPVESTEGGREHGDGRSQLSHPA